MSTPKDEEMKVRVPRAMKADFQKLAASRTTSEAAIAREAFLEYLKNHASELKEATAPYPATTPAAPLPAGKPVTYRKALKKDTQRKILDIVKREVSQGKASPPPTK